MNWEYIITHWEVYHTPRLWGDRFRINEQNKVIYKTWEPIEKFDNLVYRTDFKKTTNDFFKELWELESEKWNLMVFKNKSWDKIYTYNSKEKIKEFDNGIIYSNILFEDRENQIIHQTENFCSFVLNSNIDQLSKVAKLETIKNKKEFLNNISNSDFLKKYINLIDEKIMEDLFLLWKWVHIGYLWKIYLYAFVDIEWKLSPIYFNSGDLLDFDVSTTQSYDKIDIIMKMEWKEKITLFWSKILENIMLLKKDYYTEETIQAFYNKLFINNENYTLKEDEQK